MVRRFTISSHEGLASALDSSLRGILAGSVMENGVVATDRTNGHASLPVRHLLPVPARHGRSRAPDANGCSRRIWAGRTQFPHGAPVRAAGSTLGFATSRGLGDSGPSRVVRSARGFRQVRLRRRQRPRRLTIARCRTVGVSNSHAPGKPLPAALPNRLNPPGPRAMLRASPEYRHIEIG